VQGGKRQGVGGGGKAREGEGWGGLGKDREGADGCWESQGSGGWEGGRSLPTRG